MLRDGGGGGGASQPAHCGLTLGRPHCLQQTITMYLVTNLTAL